MVWPKSGSITNSDTSISSKHHQPIEGRRHFPDAWSISANNHGRPSRTNAGLGGFGGLDVDADERESSAAKPLTSGPNIRRRHYQRDRRDRQTPAAPVPADMLGRTGSDTPIRTMRGRQQEHEPHVAVERRWKGSRPDPRRQPAGLAASDRMTPPQDQREDRREREVYPRSTTIPKTGWR